MSGKSVQDTWAPQGICFGCGPANAQGLQLKSFPDGDGLTATWQPRPEHQAFEGVLNGGIIGALLDCQCDWAATMHVIRTRQLSEAPTVVTADYAISLKRPCPVDQPVTVRARVVDSQGDRFIVEGELEAQGKIRAACRGTFVLVKHTHPAAR